MTTALDAAHALAGPATRAYNEIVSSDGATANSWRAVSRDLHVAAAALEDAGETTSTVNFVRDRAIDAGHNAVRCDRMVAQAAARFGRTCLDLEVR